MQWSRMHDICIVGRRRGAGGSGRRGGGAYIRHATVAPAPHTAATPLANYHSFVPIFCRINGCFQTNTLIVRAALRLQNKLGYFGYFNNTFYIFL